MKFDLFVLPFTAGLVVMVALLVFKYLKWLKALSKEEKGKIKQNVFSFCSLKALKEIFLECLLHRRIFKVNLFLGFMHTSLAFGWFLLIVMGNVESKFFSDVPLNPPYYPIFFRFFEPAPSAFTFSAGFTFFMDFFLLVILSGIVLAFTKRFYSKMFGMKKTTVMKPGDKFALISLWFIFPLRLLAESFTSGVYGHGGFLTGSVGRFFASFLPVGSLIYPAWWAYSVSLGVFFVALPFSRYMHIPTEALLIFLRQYGLKTGKENGVFSDIEINSCPRCGICIDKCQLASAAHNYSVQSVYFLRSVREKSVEEKVTFDCLLCGRCKEYCPVKIDTVSIRQNRRSGYLPDHAEAYNYLKPARAQKADVIYFAGCMTHLTPAIQHSMLKIFRAARENFWFMDEDGSVCCGRPLMMAGKAESAKMLMEHNIAAIKASGAKLLITSCPICYRVFREEYHLDIKVMHHTQYLMKLINENRVQLSHQDLTVVYHDPCELGRGCGVYEEPRAVLQNIAALQKVKNEREHSLCCGGSLGNLQISTAQRTAVQKDVVARLSVNNPDVIVTACPSCKKTLNIASPVPVKDIAEIFVQSLEQPAVLKPHVFEKEPLQKVRKEETVVSFSNK